MSQASAYLLNPKYSFELTYCLYIKNILPCCLLRNLSKISFFCCSRGWSCCLSQEVRTPCLSESECKGTTFFRTDKLFAIFFYDFLNFSFPHPVLAPSLIIYIYAREGNCNDLCTLGILRSWESVEQISQPIQHFLSKIQHKRMAEQKKVLTLQRNRNKTINQSN